MVNFRFGQLRDDTKFNMFLDGTEQVFVKKKLFGFVSELSNWHLSKEIPSAFNAVNLEDGSFILLDDNILVTPID